MLEKSPCKIHVSTLRAIFLLEADLNSLHKIILNQNIILALEQCNLIPTEIVGGRKGQATIHNAINTKLTSDISNKVKALSVVISTNDANYCDIVAHPFASLTAQCFGVHVCHVLVLLKAVQSMSILQ